MISQLGIAIFGVLAIWLSQSQSYEARKWASVAGLISQPFWFWASYTSEQWGILALSAAYSVAWARGFWTYWIRGGGMNVEALSTDGLAALHAIQERNAARMKGILHGEDFAPWQKEIRAERETGMRSPRRKDRQ